MAELHTYKKLPSDPCLTEEQITAYIDGKLSAAEQHACEKHILDCEMCEDAVEGLALVKDRSVLALPLKTSETQSEGKVIPLRQPRRLMYAAAAVLVLILGSTLLIKMMSTSDEMSSENLALNKEVSFDSSTAPFQSLEEEKPVAGQDKMQSVAPEPGKKEAESKNAQKVVVGEGMNQTEVAQEITVAESEQAGATYDLQSPAEEAPMLADERADGDDEANDKVVNAPKVEGPGKDNADQEQLKEKKSLVDFAKSGVTLENKKRSEVKQDAYFEDSRDVPVAPQSVANTQSGNASPRAQGGAKATMDAPATDSVVVGYTTVADANTVVTDSVGADQLELSYQNGLNLLNAGQTTNAIVMFDKVLADKNHARYEDAEFQKAKALIKANRKEEAKTLLKSIEAKKGKHATEATELLKTIQ